MIKNSLLWVVTDVDGTLMDHSYDLTPAKKAINILKSLEIPIILCTSKTAAEVKLIRKEVCLRDPYIVENGAAIYARYSFSVKGGSGMLVNCHIYKFFKNSLEKKHNL